MAIGKYLFTLLSANLFATGQPCIVLLEQCAKFYNHGWYGYESAARRDAETLLRAITGAGPGTASQQPQLNSESLRTLLEFALENAAGHGSSGKGSRVTFEVKQESDGFIHVRIRNARIHPLPATLSGVVFSPESVVQRVPDNERDRGDSKDRSGGLQGKGLPSMISALKNVVPPNWPVTAPPTMTWQEIAPEGSPLVEFELKLPLSTRVLKPRR